VVGLDAKIAVVVDPSIYTDTAAVRETQTSEAPNDPVQLTELFAICERVWR